MHRPGKRGILFLMEVRTVAEEKQPCILYEDRPVCIHCGDCRCELEPDKVCDNCMRCLQEGSDFRSVLIDGVMLDGAQAGKPESEAQG